MATFLLLILTYLERSINPLANLVDEVIERVHHYHIIRVIGTPVSGKTAVMKLMVNRLLENYGPTTPIYALTGWQKQKVRVTSGWARYLEQKTSGQGRDIEPGWCSFIGFERAMYTTVPMVFATRQEISLRSGESNGEDGWGLLPRFKSAGLMLGENEAMDVVTRYASAALQPFPYLTSDFKKGWCLTNNGHIDSLTSLTHVLHDVLGFYDLVQRGVSIYWRTTNKILSSQPLQFVDLRSGYPFTKGRPTSNRLRDPAASRGFKTAIANTGIYKSSLKTESKDFKHALRDIWHNRRLHAKRSSWDIHYVFASHVHRCQCFLKKISFDAGFGIPLPRAAVEATTHL
ncbi:hypothetical protein BDV40DRAFT_291661 [Aspergillus tamarii]|uniref:P-loop containing nucleoside triphosphate hydrolase protein n=1 Tax=Aspergillus tamarii TaxID=41984 RepID=A0A5N6UJ33_ASPTM|nr:hypothetical protein BDV40DRAFT_291661 [Aspergillus tamarii]